MLWLSGVLAVLGVAAAQLLVAKQYGERYPVLGAELPVEYHLYNRGNEYCHANRCAYAVVQ